jgi:ArsR family transcriptional regulator
MISKVVFEMQAQLCQAMGHAARLEIVHILQDGSQHVSSLAQAMGLSQATLSGHLAVLRHHGMVEVQRQGQENVYHLANPKIGTVYNLMREVLAEQIAHQSEIAKTMSGQA